MLNFEKIKSFTAITLFTSLVVHLSIFFVLQLTKKDKTATKPDRIEFVVIDKPKDIEKKQVLQKKKSKLKKVQIVEQNNKALNEEIPDKQYFLSKNNQRVKEQIKAKSSGDFKNDAGKGQSGKSKKDRAKKKKTANKKTKITKGGIKLGKLLPKHSYSSEKNFETNEASSGQRSQSNDYLKGIKDGNQTILNTREFIYYAYYERIRGKIRKFWEPVIRDKVKHVFQTGRKLASIDHKTGVIITLDKTGALINVQIKDGSGVRDLDEAAIEAFKSAEPFPNPPAGIIENDGKIRIDWNFVLEA